MLSTIWDLDGWFFACRLNLCLYLEKKILGGYPPGTPQGDASPPEGREKSIWACCISNESSGPKECHHVSKSWTKMKIQPFMAKIQLNGLIFNLVLFAILDLAGWFLACKLKFCVYVKKAGGGEGDNPWNPSPFPEGRKNQYGHIVYEMKVLDPRNAMIPAKNEKKGKFGQF